MPDVPLHNGVFTIPDPEAASPSPLLGKGSYGSVYAGVQRLLTTERAVAVKLHDDRFLLDREVKIYRHLWKALKRGYAPTLRVPRLLWEGHTDDGAMRALVMERLGPSLDKLFDAQDKQWTPATVCWVASEALGLLQGLHELGIVHRDIKPDNFALGYGSGARAQKLHLFDFGLSAEYLDASREHLPTHGGLSLIGTMRYSSIATHEGLRQSRRDDLEALCYVLLYFWRGALAWQALLKDESTDRREKSARILAAKQQLHDAVSTMPTDSPPDPHEPPRPMPSPLAEFFLYVRGLEYDETPRYAEWVGRFATTSACGDPAPSPAPRDEATEVATEVATESVSTEATTSPATTPTS